MQNVSYIVAVDGRPYGNVRRSSTAKALYFEALELCRDGQKVECHRITDELVDVADLTEPSHDDSESTD